MQFTVDLSGVSPAVRDRIVKHVQHEDVAAYHLACIEQAKAKQLLDQSYAGSGRIIGVKEGIGPMTGIMHVGIRNWLAAKYGTRTVYSDPDFMPWIRKKDEAFRGLDGRSKIGVGWTPNLERAVS